MYCSITCPWDHVGTLFQSFGASTQYTSVPRNPGSAARPPEQEVHSALALLFFGLPAFDGGSAEGGLRSLKGGSTLPARHAAKARAQRAGLFTTIGFVFSPFLPLRKAGCSSQCRRALRTSRVWIVGRSLAGRRRAQARRPGRLQRLCEVQAPSARVAVAVG